MTLHVSKNQKRAVYGEKRLVFVPYKYRLGVPLVPSGCEPNKWCGCCACNKSDGTDCCDVPHEITRCREYRRNDQTHGYWKEVTE